MSDHPPGFVAVPAMDWQAIARQREGGRER